LAGKHFSDCAALGGEVTPGAAIFGGAVAEVVTVACREGDGSPRTATAVDAEVEALVVDAVAAGRRVLLNLVDVSKTGIIAPSLYCALELRQRFPVAVDVLVDACQFRLAPSTLRTYLENSFWVALTGSKFVGGPAFSGVLLLPSTASGRLCTHILSPALNAYSARADWPHGWMGRHSLNDTANFIAVGGCACRTSQFPCAIGGGHRWLSRSIRGSCSAPSYDRPVVSAFAGTETRSPRNRELSFMGPDADDIFLYPLSSNKLAESWRATEPRGDRADP
jgi:hypothetical protein